MEKALISHNKHWNSHYKGLYNRALLSKLIKKLTTRHIQVLQGIRRSGKSTIFKLLINHLIKSVDAKEILYVNLDDPFFIRYSNAPQFLYEIIETAEKLTGKKISYLFLDEIQAIQGWEHYVKVAYDNELFTKIFITGSNSSLLNSEYAKLLSGRYLSDMVYPLNFAEMLEINGVFSYAELIEQSPKVLSIVDTMLKYGSFFEIVNCDEEYKRELITAYYDTVLLKDCIANNRIRDTKSFRELSYYIISNITFLYSYNSLARAIGIHDQSAKEYIQYLQDAWFIYELKQFSYSLKEQQNNKKKPYIIDNSFLNLSFKFSSGSGVLLESLVFSELIKENKEIYFYNKGFECDFIVKNKDHVDAIQVCYELNDQNREREVRGLEKIKKLFGSEAKRSVRQSVRHKIIITYNQEEHIGESGIQVIPFWKYFHGF